MSTTAHLQNATAEPRQTADTNLIVQRKCACGAGASSLTGECAECSKKLVLQTKLRINEPNDVYEQEADRVAEQVLAEPAHPDVTGAPLRIQRFSGQSNGQVNLAPASVDHVLAGSGRPLEPELQQDMEQRFGHDFLKVRVYSDEAAEQSAREVSAHAYTVGHSIVFGAGRFAPGTSEGRRLIAHELTHVVQQSGTDGTRAGLTQTINRTGRTLQRQPAAAGRREARITVVFEEDDAEFYRRVIRAIQRSGGFRGVQVSFGQPFQNPILAIHSRLALAGTKTGSRVVLRASVFFDPEEFHKQLTDGRLEIEQDARLRETTVAAVLKPRDNFAGRSLTRLGLAELADLSFTASPTVTATDLGGLKWDLYGGGGILTPAAADDGTAVFTAGATPGAVSLDLLVASGLAAGRRVATLNLRAVAPDDAVMERVPGSGSHHLKDHCGVGFCGRIFLRPVDVSFQNIQFSEGDGVGEANGFYQRLNGVSHCGNNPCNVPMNVDRGNSTTGCKVWMVDTVATSSDPPPFASGYRLWRIDWQYRVGTGNWVRFTVANQLQTADAAGQATISKKGSILVSRNAADPTSIVDCSTAHI